MAATDWLRRWKLPRIATQGWGDDCPAGLPVPDNEGCAATNCDSIALTALAEGERAWVTCLSRPGESAAARLSALGILPGRQIEILQRYPVFVLAMGYAEIAIDEALALTVRVRRI